MYSIEIIKSLYFINDHLTAKLASGLLCCLAASGVGHYGSSCCYTLGRGPLDVTVGSAARPAIVEFQTVVFSFTFERQVPTLSLSVAIVVLSEFCRPKCSSYRC